MITTGIRSDERGQALVEFALVLPIVLLLLFGILQVALVLEARQTVAYAARVAADTYARTLDPVSADAAAAAAGAQLRPQLRAPVASVSYAITQEETQTCVRTQRRSFGRSSCVQYAPSRTTTDRAATPGAPGKSGDLVIARLNYRYPSPVRAAFGPFRFPAELTMTAEGVARIETTAQPRTSTSASTPLPALPTPTPIAGPIVPPSPTAAPSPTASPMPPSASRCYRIDTVQDVWDAYLPYTGEFRVNGSPAGSIRLVPGSTATVSLVLKPKPHVASAALPGHSYGTTVDPAPLTPVQNETITVLSGGFTRVYSGGRYAWAFKQGGYVTFNYWVRLNITPGAC